MSSHLERVGLLQVDPDIGRFMTDDERRAAGSVALPVERVPRGRVDFHLLLDDPLAFAMVVRDGLLFSHPRIGDQVALRLLGPGDVIAVPGASRSMLLSEAALTAAAPTTLVVLGSELLGAARRWPRIVASLQARLAEQSERLAAQLAICQLPRVDQRLLAMMWLLAESWGQVTPVGTRLQLGLTHDALGALIGARRSTVTLAIGGLTERGAIIRQDRGWLLLERPVEPSDTVAQLDAPALCDDASPSWRAAAGQRLVDSGYAALPAEVSRMREEHLRVCEEVGARLRRSAQIRERVTASRRRIAEEALNRRRAPS